MNYELRGNESKNGCFPVFFICVEDKQRTVTDIELYAFAKVLGVSVVDLFENIE